MGTNEPNHEAWRPPTVRELLRQTQHVTRCSHRKARLAWNLSHGNRNAFRVHKKIQQTVATGRLQPITTTQSQNGQFIVYLAFFGIIDRISYTGQNYRTNTIIIVHLATLGTCDDNCHSHDVRHSCERALSTCSSQNPADCTHLKISTWWVLILFLETLLTLLLRFACFMLFLAAVFLPN